MHNVQLIAAFTFVSMLFSSHHAAVVDSSLRTLKWFCGELARDLSASLVHHPPTIFNFSASVSQNTAISPLTPGLATKAAQYFNSNKRYSTRYTPFLTGDRGGKKRSEGAAFRRRQARRVSKSKSTNSNTTTCHDDDGILTQPQKRRS